MIGSRSDLAYTDGAPTDAALRMSLTVSGLDSMFQGRLEADDGHDDYQSRDQLRRRDATGMAKMTTSSAARLAEAVLAYHQGRRGLIGVQRTRMDDRVWNMGSPP